MANEAPLPPPAEDAQQQGGTVEEIIARAVENIVTDGEGGESLPASTVAAEPAPPSADAPTESPDSEAAPETEESEATEQAEPVESGDSPSPIEVGGQQFTQDELTAMVEAHANRDALNKAAQEAAAKVTEQVQSLEQARAQIGQEQAQLTKEREDNQVYANYLQWLNEGNTGDIREFTRQSGQQRPAAQPQQQQPQDLDARLNALVDKRMAEREQGAHQQSIQRGIDDWVADAVSSEPALKGRERAYQSDILHKLVLATGEQKLTPFDFPEGQIKSFLREYAREAAQNETKLSETTLADRLDKAAKTGAKLPAAARTQGTPLPVPPNDFKMDLKKMAEETPDTDEYFRDIAEGLKLKADELSSMANNQG